MCRGTARARPHAGGQLRQKLEADPAHWRFVPHAALDWLSLCECDGVAPPLSKNHHDANRDKDRGDYLRQREWSEHLGVHSDELDNESRRTGKDKVPA